MNLFLAKEVLHNTLLFEPNLLKKNIISVWSVPDVHKARNIIQSLQCL